MSRKKAYEGVRDFEDTIVRLPKDVTIEEALDPQSPHYIIDTIVRRNQPTLEEENNAMIDALKITREDIRRNPGETLDEFEKRKK